MVAAFAGTPPLLPCRSRPSRHPLCPRRSSSQLPLPLPRPPLLHMRASAAISDARGDVASARKLRASVILQRELPRLLHLEGGPREMFRGGEHEMFTPGVEFSFPMWDGKGRRMLKMLLMSLPLQASCGLFYPVIEDIEIASPSRLRLDVSYTVRCSTLAENGGQVEKGELPQRRTTLRVRTRLRFDEEGRITEWRDTWDKGIRQFLSDVAGVIFSETGANVEGAAEAGPTTSSTNAGEHSHRVGSSEEDIGWHDDSAYELDEESPELVGHRLASRIIPGGPALTPEAMAERVQEVERFLRVDFAQLMLPGGNVENAYELFHNDSVLETYDFVVEGVESLALLHKLSRADGRWRFSVMDVHCLGVVWQSSKIVVAKFLFRGRRRVGGIFHQAGVCVSLQLNTSGEIVLAKVLDEDLGDASFDIFALRSTNRAWIW